MWLAKVKRAKKARKAKRVKKVKTPKATRAKRGRKETTLGPSWTVARVPPKGARNNCFCPFVHPSTFFHLSIHLHFSSAPSPFVHPSTGLLTAWPPPHFHFLIHFIPPPGLSRSFRPTRSLALSCLISTPCPTGLFPSSSPRPSRSFRPTRSMASSFSSDQPWLSRSFRPTLSPSPLPQSSTA